MAVKQINTSANPAFVEVPDLPDTPTRLIQQLDADVDAPTAANVSKFGAVSFNLVVPAGRTRLKLALLGVFVLATVSNAPNLVQAPISAVVDLTTVTFLYPNSAGLYTVTAGNTILVSATVVNVFTQDFVITAATAAQWGVGIDYLFS